MPELPESITSLFQPTIFKKGAILVFLPLAINCIWIAMLATEISKTAQLAEEERKQFQLVDSLNVTLTGTFLILSDVYNVAFTGKEVFRKSGMVKLQELQQNVWQLEKLIPKSGTEKFSAAKFNAMIDDCVKELNTLSTPTPDANLKDFADQMHTSRVLFRNMSGQAEEVQKLLITSKAKLEKLRQSQTNARQADQMILAFGLFGNVAFALLLLFLFKRDISSRLDILTENAGLLPKRLPLNRRVGGNDELSYLDSELHMASHELIQAWQHRDALVGMVAHDLRSPLSSCDIAIEILKKSDGETLTASGQKQVKNIQSNIKRLIALISDLLTIDKLEAGELQLDKSDCSLAELANTAIETLQNLAAAKSIRVENRCEGVDVYCDGPRILQVLTNYLSNALKFSPRNSTIIIFARTQSGEVTVSVQDQGKGLTKQERKRVFEKFYQAKNDVSVKGFGLGLAICKLIIESHEGKVGVDSEAGQGARFWFTLEESV